MHINGEFHPQMLFLLPSISIGAAFGCCEACDNEPKEAPEITLITLSLFVWSLHIAFGGEASA